MRLGIVLGAYLAAAPAAFVAAGGSAASAQQPDEPRLEDLEEQVLRSQVENYLNEFARWDGERRRVVIERRGRGAQGERGGKDQGEGPLGVGGLEPVVEMILQRTIEPDGEGRLRLREQVRLRPFAKVVQDYIAEGGIEDIERFQRFRGGNGENPFKDGMPPRVQKAIGGLLKALNDQTLTPMIPPRARARDDGDEDARKAEEKARKAEEKARKAAEEARRAREEADRSRERGGERREELPRQRRREIEERIIRRFDVDPEDLEEMQRYAEDLMKQAEKDLDRLRGELRERWQEFSESDRGRDLRERLARLGRRAEDELRRALESEEVRDRLEDAQRRALEFLASPEGQEMQRRMLEWLESEDGRDVRRRLDEFLSSERGRDLLKRLGERFAGRGRPDRERERAQPDRRREEERRVEEERREERRRVEDEKRRKDEPRREERRRDRRSQEF